MARKGQPIASRKAVHDSGTDNLYLVWDGGGRLFMTNSQGALPCLTPTHLLRFWIGVEICPGLIVCR